MRTEQPKNAHHLMRVRVRQRVFAQLKQVAEEETERTGELVTISDLVRAACANHLLVYSALRSLENAPPVLEGDAPCIIK